MENECCGVCPACEKRIEDIRRLWESNYNGDEYTGDGKNIWGYSFDMDREDIMEKYIIKTGVWDYGWQPHDIADQKADTLEEARRIAGEIVSDGAQLGRPIVTIMQGSGVIETIGWKQV
jgi:hypothetical protein